MDWLNQIKMSQGSVEENALLVAEAINSTARICIGKLSTDTPINEEHVSSLIHFTVFIVIFTCE